MTDTLESLETIRLRKRTRLVRDSISTVAAMLVKKSIKVTISGSSAYCMHNIKTGEPERVNLPSLPDVASEKLLDATQGFLDHECAHALFTDPLARIEANNLKLDKLHNIFEDVFIERKNVELFPGSKATIKAPRILLIEYISKKAKELEKNPDATEIDWFRLLLVCVVRAWGGHFELIDFMSDTGYWGKIPTITEMLKKRGVIADCPSIKDSWHALELTCITRDAMLDLQEDIEREDERGGESGDSGESESGDGMGDSSAPKSDDESEGEGDGDADSDEGEDADDGEGESGAGDEDSDGDESGEKPSKAGDDIHSRPTGGKLGVTPSPKEWEEPDLDSVESIVKEAIETEINEALANDQYIPYSTESDVIEVLDASGVSSSQVSAMERRVSHIIGAMQSQLEGVILAQKQSRWQQGMRSGRINASSLHRLRTNDDRVFRNREIREEKDTAFSLLLDCSGSMSSSRRYAAAAESAWALGETLDRLGVPCEIIGFTTGDHMYPRSSEFSRFESLYMPIFKSFDEPFSAEVKKRLVKMWGGEIPMSQNVDGECVRVAADRLMKRKEDRHVLITLSDGFPASYAGADVLYKHLKDVVSGLSKDGVECIGLGIQSESVEQFYPNNAVINSVEDLAGATMDKIRECLIEGL